MIPTWLRKNGHVPSPWVVSYSILCLPISNDWQVDLLSMAPSQTCWSVTVDGCPHHCQGHRALITASIRTPPKEDEPPGVHLGIIGALCHWHHLPCPMMHQAWASLVLLTSPWNPPSSRPHIQSSTVQVPAKGQMALPDPQGYPSCLTFVFFSLTLSTIAWQPSCTVFAVASACTLLQSQLTGPAKLNPTSLTLV